MLDYGQVMKRQQVLADFGELALHSDDLDEVLTEACRLVAEALGTDRAKILEIREDEQCLFVRAGVGWAPDVVGRVRLPMGEHSSETFAINASKPIITQDISKEERFDVPEFLKKAGVVALVNVPIRIPGGKAYGLLQVDAVEPRDFGLEDVEFLRTYAIILGPVIDRLRKVSALRTSEERFRLVVGQALDYAIFVSDPEDRITDWLPGAEAVYGWSAEEALGQPSSIVFTPEDRAAGASEREAETARREGRAANVRWHLRKDGTRVFIEGSVTALYRENGEVSCFVKIGQDVTARRESEEALRKSEARFSQFAASSSDGIWIRDAATLAMEYASPAVRTIYGCDPEAILGDVERWVALIVPEDRDIARKHLEQAQAGEAVTHEFRIVRCSDGERRWIRDTTFPLVDEHGGVERLGGIAEDVTEAKLAAKRQEVLVNELQHRARNLLGVVTAVADRTVKQGGSVEAFEERLQALSQAQGLLSKSGNDTVAVGALIRAELAAHADGASDRISMAGPEVLLTSRQVQNFALAVHELTTNAVKHGALRDGAGQLSVTWDVVLDRRERRRLALNWIESGVAVRRDATHRRGYGTELIQEALAYALRAEVAYELGDNGVRCRIEMPVS
jgi:PAS domain S-box-containing protein